MMGIYDDLIEKANEGNKEAINALCENAASKLKSGQPLDEKLAVWLSEALGYIGNGVDFKKAFGLGEAGRPKKSDEDLTKEYRIFAEVEIEYKKWRSYTTAQEQVAEKYGLTSGEAVRKKREEVKKELNSDPDLPTPEEWVQAAVDFPTTVQGIMKVIAEMTEDQLLEHGRRAAERRRNREQE